MSLFRFVRWVSEGIPVIIYGDGNQSRDFTYVDDIAHGTIAGVRPLGYEIINLGSDRPVVLMDAIRLAEQLVGKKAKIEYKARHPADLMATWASVDKAEDLLNWRPETLFKEGLHHLVDWYRTNQAWLKDIKTELE
jgi:nucleoside-diphosphate-sugar epimerase